MRKFALLITCLLLCGMHVVFAQSRTITGTVTDADDGSTLPGVSVVVKGTSIGTVTDIDGKFSLNVPADAKVLRFSFVGYAASEIEITSAASINVKLTRAAYDVDEVIVSGVASETPRTKMSVSVGKIGAEALQEVPAASAASALQGKMAGVTVVNATGGPGEAATILVRGATQLAGSQDPLIILDGAIMEGTLADINVDDIESIEVVKGASASALYGSRAGNGVISITTKRGKNISKSLVTFRNEFGMNRLAKKYDLATHHAYKMADDWETAKGKYTKYDGVTYPADYDGTQAFDGARALEVDQYLDNAYGVLQDHEGFMFPGNTFYTNYLSVAGNMGKTNFMTSFENFNQGGLLFETEGYKRNSFRVNIDHHITDNLIFSASNLFVKSSTDEPGGDSKYNGGNFFNVLLASPDVDFFRKNPDGQSYLFIPDPWETTNENPLYNLSKIEVKNTRERMLGSYNLKWIITDFLNMEGKYAFENSARNWTQYYPFDTYVRSGEGFTYSEGSLDMYNSKDQSENAQATLNFSNKFGDLNVKARLSYLYENEVYESFETYGYDFGVKGIPSFDAIKEGQFTSTSFQSQIVSNNFFAIAYLDYKDKYIFDGMFRYDGSSLFGSEERWQPYFRVSGAWRISEDIKIPGIDEFKIRSAYGTAGQRPHLFAMQYEVMSIDGGISTKEQLGNKNLKPAKSAEFEVGLNIDFLKRFRLEVVYSSTTTDDQFLEVPLASHLGGWLTQWQNAGAMESSVWEASLEINVMNQKDFKWDARFVFDRGTSMITRLDVPPYQYGPEGQEANKCFYIKEGEKFGVMYGYDWVRTLDQMAQQLKTGDDISKYTVNSDGYVIKQGTEGTANEKPLKLLDEEGNPLFGKIGDINPDFKLGFSNTITYKGLSLYFLLDWKQGGQLYNKSAQWLTRDDRHGMMDQFGKPENQKKAIPYYKEFYDVNSFNSFWVEDGTYLKLREVSVAYTIGQSALSKSGKGFVKGIKIGFIGRNLLTFTNYSGYDPEVMTTNGTQFFYYDFMGYPNYRSYSLSLELKF